MLEFLAKSFEKTCAVLAWLNVIVWLIFGTVFGVYLKDYLYIDGFLGVIVVIGVALAGILIGFVADILIFGFFAQIVSIRKNIESLAEKYLK